MPRSTALMHRATNQVESKPITVLDVSRIDLPRHKRVALLVRVVGGVGKAAAIANKSRSTITNWCKEGADQPIEGMLALATAAHVSMDWLVGADDGVVDHKLQSALDGMLKAAS